MLDALVTSGTRRWVRVRRRRRSFGEEAGPTAAPHLGAANVSVDTVAGVTLLLPSAAVRKLKTGVTTRLPESDELLTARPSVSWRTNAAVTVDFVHAG